MSPLTDQVLFHEFPANRWALLQGDNGGYQLVSTRGYPSCDNVPERLSLEVEGPLFIRQYIALAQNPRLNSLNLRYAALVDGEKEASPFPLSSQLTSLILPAFKASQMPDIPSLSELEFLSVDLKRWTDKEQENFFRQIDILALRISRFASSALNSMHPSTRLKSLSLVNSNATDCELFKILLGLSSLEQLELQECPKIAFQKPDKAPLTLLPRLAKLSFRFQPDLTYEAAKTVVQIAPNLTEMDLSCFDSISPDAVLHLQSLPLTKIRFFNCTSIPRKFYESIAKITSLERFVVRSHLVLDRFDLSPLQQLPRLERASFKVETESDLYKIAACATLRILLLETGNIDLSRGLIQIFPFLIRLEFLDLSYFPLTSKAYGQIPNSVARNLKNIKVLVLSAGHISDPDFAVTQQNFAALAQAMPEKSSLRFIFPFPFGQEEKLRTSLPASQAKHRNVTILFWRETSRARKLEEQWFI
ncbi:MAG: hypothetical protein A3F09_02595 [Chlamydiae bacterium RIFCSPHIGHO2_12_FULL_49_11]|nr:MAG: hypothetical protein A3F09_02595 [Chlamydiae bacterium RIFCSPHIGHO2_12_FULL_49_11]